MLSFCPSCAMLLQIEPASSGGRLRLFCPTCPYIYNITTKIVIHAPLVKKEEGPILNADDAKKFLDKTAATCPRCHNGEAYFEQMQTRGADEPMTTIYKCVSCGFDWREN